MAKKCRCPRRTYHKRRGSPRFSDECIRELKTCQKEELQATGSLRSAGKTCMKRLQQCARTRGAMRRRRGRK